MKQGNVLVIGNSGAGKSTLINAVMGEEAAKATWGTRGVTTDLSVYEPQDESIPFRVIDTIGFEAGLIQRLNAANAVKRWCAEGVKKDDPERVINVIWFCVDGSRGRLFAEDVKSMLDAVKMWKSVPVIAVITKSYAEGERANNIAMVKKLVESSKELSARLMDIIPVVSKTYSLNESAYVEPCGITELVEATNVLLPEGIKAAQNDIAAYVLNQKRLHAQTVVTAATAAAAAVGAIPIPFSDAVLLTPAETAEVTAIARVYGVKNIRTTDLFQTIIEAGTVSAVAKTFISGLKAIPGVNVAAGVLNAIIAGAIAAAIGEGCIVIFEKVYLGEMKIEDTEWVRKIIESEMTNTIIRRIEPTLKSLGENADKAEIVRAVREIAENLFKKDGGK